MQAAATNSTEATNATNTDIAAIAAVLSSVMAVSTNGLTTTGSTANIVQIFEFIANYRISDVNSDLQNRMTTAVANLLKVNSSQVVLSFSAITLRALRVRRAQRDSVLVRVGLINFQWSTAFASVITQDNINHQMAEMGLKPVVLQTNAVSNSPGIWTEK
jgi:hypothetical protein